MSRQRFSGRHLEQAFIKKKTKTIAVIETKNFENKRLSPFFKKEKLFSLTKMRNKKQVCNDNYIIYINKIKNMKFIHL